MGCIWRIAVAGKKSWRFLAPKYVNAQKGGSLDRGKFSKIASRGSHGYPELLEFAVFC